MYVCRLRFFNYNLGITIIALAMSYKNFTAVKNVLYINVLVLTCKLLSLC